MSERDRLRSVVAEDWPADSEAMRLFEALLGKVRSQATEYLTLPHLKKISGLDMGLGELEKLAEYFAGERLQLLETRYQLIRSKDQITEIEPRKVFEAVRSGEFFDPVSGEQIRDWKRDVVVFYSGTENLRAILRELESE